MPPSNYRVAHVEPDDSVTILGMVEKAFEESFYKGHDFNVEYYGDMLYHESSPEIFIRKLVRRDEIIGLFFGNLTTMGFCHMKIGMDQGFYIKPEYRKTGAAVLLLDSFVEWCEDNGATPMLMIHYGKDNQNTYDFLYNYGMEERGRLFAKG